jgi:ribonuclease HII
LNQKRIYKGNCLFLVMKVLGIDEAGRGPVIGPMIMAGVMVEEGSEEKLGDVKDSKLLTHGKRLELDKHVREVADDFMVVEISPAEIDKALADDKMNLNWLEAHKQAEIINSLGPDKAIIDCPSVNCEAFEKYLRGLIDDKVELVVENKADENYKSCSAASILAKVLREKRMEEIREKYGDAGPGYPANAVTIKFLKENWDKYPEIFRKSWSTYKKVAGKSGVGGRGNGSDGYGQRKLENF